MITGKQLSDLLAQKAPNAYYVGGCLLGSLQKKYSSDIDLALPKEEVKEVSYTLARHLKASVFEMDPTFCVWRLTTKEGLQIDLSAIIGKDIYEDLGRRDFTANAFALSTTKKPEIKIKEENGRQKVLLCRIRKTNLIDLFEGQKDLKEKVLRATNNKVFIDDPLRMFRAFRICAERGFKIEENTFKLIKKYAHLANQPAGERVQEEFRRLFFANNTAFYLSEMERADLFKYILPEIEAQKTCAECYYGVGGVWKHTLLVVERMEFLLNNLSLCEPRFYKQIAPLCKDIYLYKMTAFLHDIAKPETAKMINNRLRFFYHEQQGARKAEKFLDYLKSSTATKRQICKMIEFHLRPSNLASNDIVTDRAIYNFFKVLGPAGIPMLLLCWSDYTSYITLAEVKKMLKHADEPVMSLAEGKKKGAKGKTLRHLQMLNFLFHKYFNENKKIILPERFLSGTDVMNILGLENGGKLVGSVLEHITEAQVEGKINNREEALSYLTKNKGGFLSQVNQKNNIPKK